MQVKNCEQVLVALRRENDEHVLRLEQSKKREAQIARDKHKVERELDKSKRQMAVEKETGRVRSAW